MANASWTQPTSPRRRTAATPAIDPRDDLWAKIIRHRERLRTFQRPVRAFERTEKGMKVTTKTAP